MTAILRMVQAYPNQAMFGSSPMLVERKGQDRVRLERVDATAAKGWYLGPWNSALTAAIGYAHAGIDEPHLHRRITEIYLVAQGEAVARVEHKTVRLTPGDVLVVEPGEAHSFMASSPDYLHFVVHLPGLAADEARAEKVIVPRKRLGLD
jgi:mannose-6-phosphate isomerase-like protein (cupin superfamily)